MFCLFIAVLLFIQIAVNMIFVAEEKIVSDHSKKICKILAVVPRHFTNIHMLKFIMYMFMCRIFYYSIDFAFDLKLVKNGYYNISRSLLSNIDLLLYPINFLMAFSTIYYLKKGQLVRMFHLNTFIVVSNGFFRYLNYTDLIQNRQVTRNLFGRVFSGWIAGMDFTTYFMIGFFNTIVNKSVGNTGITCLIALLNQNWTVSQSIGLYAIDQFGFDSVVPGMLVIQLIVLLLLYRYATIIDKKDTKLYAKI